MGSPYYYLSDDISFIFISKFEAVHESFLPHIVFPTLALILSALQQAHGNFDSALEMLLSGSVDDGPPQPAPTAAPPVARVEAVAVVAPKPASPPPASGGDDSDIPEHFVCAITCVRKLIFWLIHAMMYHTCML